MKNQHLLPVNIVDLIEKFNNPNTHDTERMNLLQRIEAIRDYCTIAVNKFNKTTTIKNSIRKTK